MFENIQILVPPTKSVTSADFDTIEDTLACTLPPDYRVFLTRFGSGLIDQEIYIFAPPAALRRTREIRDLFEILEDAGQLRFFAWYDNTADLFQAADLDCLVCLANSMSNDYFMILPGTPPRFFEFPRYGRQVRFVGTTMEDFLQYVDPSIRYPTQNRWLVVGGIEHQTTGGSDEILYPHTFIPEGSESLFAETEILWEPSDDGLLNDSLGWVDTGQDCTDIAFHMAQHPLLRLLEAMALHDPMLWFMAAENIIPQAELQVPQFAARLWTNSGMGGLTLYILAPVEQTTELCKWIAAEAQSLGYSIPPDLQALLS